MQGLRVTLEEAARQGIAEVAQGPAAYHAIIRQHNHWGNDGKEAGPFPLGMGREGLHGAKGIGVAAPANHGFGQEDGQRKHQGGQDIDQNEGRTAVFAHHIGKTPDVTESDSGSGKGHDDGSAAAEILSGFHLSSSFGAYYRLRRYTVNSKG